MLIIFLLYWRARYETTSIIKCSIIEKKKSGTQEGIKRKKKRALRGKQTEGEYISYFVWMYVYCTPGESLMCHYYEHPQEENEGKQDCTFPSKRNGCEEKISAELFRGRFQVPTKGFSLCIDHLRRFGFVRKGKKRRMD